MPKKKSKAAADKQVKATIKKLEADVDRANAKRARWKKKAKQHEAATASSKAKVAKLEKKLAEVPREEPTTPPKPDDTWTVTALRAEARSRGLAGYSRKSKADLLAALT